MTLGVHPPNLLTQQYLYLKGLIVLASKDFIQIIILLSIIENYKAPGQNNMGLPSVGMKYFSYMDTIPIL